MSNSDYMLNLEDKLVRDGQPDKHELAALIASGDCFVTLATRLDELTQTDDLPERIRSQMESTISVLIYLQRHYQIVAKDSDYRQ